jgi:hypothetical protein
MLFAVYVSKDLHGWSVAVHLSRGLKMRLGFAEQGVLDGGVAGVDAVAQHAFSSRLLFLSSFVHCSALCVSLEWRSATAYLLP